MRCECGSKIFVKLTPCRGAWREHIEFGPDGTDIKEGFTDDLIYGAEPKTVRCADCKKRHPNPDYQKPDVQ